MFNRLHAATVLSLALLVQPAAAQTTEADKAAALFDALALPEMVEIMREEGLAYAGTLGDDMFGGATDPAWLDFVDTVYDVDAMRTEAGSQLARELEGSDIDTMLAFFTAEPGKTIIGLEVAARRALLDDVVEAASEEAAALALADQTPRAEQVTRFVTANDLIETNVVGAMNSNLAFYRGLQVGGALPPEMTEEQMLTDVWSQEAEIRTSTSEWVYTFLMLAYQPLTDADMESYVAFSETAAGRDLNAAMFAAFDGMFEDISYVLGNGAAQFMITEDL